MTQPAQLHSDLTTGGVGLWSTEEVGDAIEDGTGGHLGGAECWTTVPVMPVPVRSP